MSATYNGIEAQSSIGDRGDKGATQATPSRYLDLRFAAHIGIIGSLHRKLGTVYWYFGGHIDRGAHLR